MKAVKWHLVLMFWGVTFGFNALLGLVYVPLLKLQERAYKYLYKYRDDSIVFRNDPDFE